MTTVSGGVAVIAMRVAQTDRRALSEAWYSALHFARTDAPLRPAPARVPAASPAVGAVRATAAQTEGGLVVEAP